MRKPKTKESPFESIRFIDNKGVERWHARDLSSLIGYDDWRNFENVLNKAMVAAKTVGSDADYHFVDVNKMVPLGSGSEGEIEEVASK